MRAARCARCKQPIWPGELMFDWNREGFVCPDCFRAYVLEMLQNHARLLAEEMDVPEDRYLNGQRPQQNPVAGFTELPDISESDLPF